MKKKINKANIKVELCSQEDVDEIFDIQNIVIENLKNNEKNFFLPFEKETYAKIIDDPIHSGEIYKAVYDKSMVGWILLSVSDRMKNLINHIPNLNGACADIDGVIVLPEYRGNNIQNILVQHIEKRAKELKICNIVAEVTINNKYSLTNLLKNGYEIKTTYLNELGFRRYILLKTLDEIK